MAEIVSPLTGGLNVARRTVSATAFAPAPTAAPTQPDPVTTGLIDKNANALTSVGTQLASIQQQVAALNGSIAQVYSGIQQNAAIDKNRDIQEQNQQRQLAEQQLREGKESVIERRIANAVMEPVQKIGSKVQFTLSNLMSVFTTLLAGWLLQQGAKALKAYSEGNKKLLEEIKNNVIKSLGIAVGVFVGIQFGLSKIIGTMVQLGATILKAVGAGLFLRPVKLLIDGVKEAARKLFNIKKPTVTPPPGTGSGTRPGGRSFTGGALNLVTALQNLGNGEITDFVMQGVLGALLLTPAGRLVSAVRTVLGVAVTADQIAEVFGSNIFGQNPDILRDVEKVKTRAEKEAKDQKTTSPQAQTTPIAQPQTPMMGENNTSNKQEEGVEPNTVSGTIPSLESLNGQGQSSAGVTPQTSMTPSAGDLSLGSGTTSGAESLKKDDNGQSAADVTPQTPMTPAAEDLSLESGMQGSLSQEQVSGMTENTSFQMDSGSMSAQISPLPSDPATTAQNVGPLPEVTPTIIPLPMPGQQQSQSGSPTGTSGVSQNVPSFDPENPNNPYVMYSHSVYNVAMV